MFDALLPPEFTVEHGDPREPSELLHAAEAALVARASEGRKREFQTGRQCARAALRRLGVEGFALLAGSSREPLWPPGIVGSITHTRERCAVAVGSASRFEGVGIDVEPAESIAEDIARRVASERELDQLPELARGLTARLVFSAKESFYKCQFYRTRQVLDFSDVEIALDAAGHFAVARIIEGQPAPELEVQGRWRISGGYLFTAAWQARALAG